ncbi:VOC family protein [Saccharopolyspora rosea]|uniref:VOC family protein n=1 Tax=Saccharopolyspora rosea TaxID=524884 RepID=A0ABW3FSL1_9PSEU|nr:VOC family protein [Saccharopolyspora rosea]
MTDTTTKTGIWPLVPYADKNAGIRFLTEAFGFTEAAVVHGDDDEIVHAELRWPHGGGIMIGTVDENNPFAKPRGSAGLYVVTDDPDGLYRRAVAAGAAVVREVADTDYGSREFAVRDPEGNTWSFGTYAGS